MIIDLTHPFLWRCRNKEDLLANCTDFQTFRKNLESQARKMFPEEGVETDEAKQSRLDELYTYKGDAFELFGEALIRLFPCDKRLGLIEDYKVITGQDVGVDGYGICGFNKLPFTVQFKYRQADHVLAGNKDHLTNFTSASLMHYGVSQTPDPITQKCNMLIISSADSLNFFTDHSMFGQKVHAICLKEIKILVDNNPTFWKLFAKNWDSSLKKLKENENVDGE